jgi:hypothetical protein
MSDWKDKSVLSAQTFRRSGAIGGLMAILIMATAPLTVGAHGFHSPLAWWLLLGLALVVLALSLHLIFDAALFRLSSSHEQEQAGLLAIDDVLSRMGLRTPNAAQLRPLEDRIRGTRRLVWLQWLALAITLLLDAILFIDATNGTPAC